MIRKDRSMIDNATSAVAWMQVALKSIAIIYFLMTFNVLETIMLFVITEITTSTACLFITCVELTIDNFSASSIERKRLIKYGMDKEMITEDHITAAVYSTAIDAIAKNPNYANTDFDFVRKMSRVAAGLDTQESLVVEQAIKKETPKAINKPEVVEEVKTVEVKTTTTKKAKEQYTIEFVDNGVVLKTSDNVVAQTISYEDINQTTQEDIESGIVPDPTCYGYAILEDSKVFIFMDMMKALKIYN